MKVKKCLSLALAALLAHAFGLSPLASDGAPGEGKKSLLAAQVKAAVVDAGKSSRVRVLLYDKTKYDGYVTEIGEDHFVVADARTGASAPIGYREVKGIKGNSFSAGQKIAIGVGVGAAVAVALAVALSGGDDEPPRDVQCVRAPCP